MTAGFIKGCDRGGDLWADRHEKEGLTHHRDGGGKERRKGKARRREEAIPKSFFWDFIYSWEDQARLAQSADGFIRWRNKSEVFRSVPYLSVSNAVYQ